MHDLSSPLFRFSADQTYRHKITAPFYFAIENRWVKPNWDCNNPHWHDYFEIEIVWSGTGLHTYNDSNVTVSAGYIYLITPADVHAIHTSADADLHLMHIRFNEYAVSEKVLGLLLQRNCCNPIKLNDEEYARVLDDINEINRQCEQKAPFYELSIRMILSAICLTILRNNQCNEENASMFDVGHKAIQKTMLYIYSNFRKKITMQDLGDLVHMSPNHLSTLFKKSTGVTCVQLIAQLRMQHAVSLLKNTDFSIETISFESGFSSVSYFISRFHAQFGMSPKEYRIKHSHDTGDTP